MKRLLTYLLCSFFIASTAAAGTSSIEETISLARVDGSEIQLLVSRPLATEKIPILLAIDGSTCLPSRSSGFVNDLHPDNAPLSGYALVVVEKPQPTPLPPPDESGNVSIGPDFQCSDTFKRYYSIDQRVLDHLRAIQHLRTHAKWWDGSLFIWGFSDGARVGSRVGSYAAETKGMVLGGFGGGVTMASEFEDHHVCAASRTDDRPACLEMLRKQFAEIRATPISSKTWNGDSNTYKAWASRLDAVEANILRDTRVPILVFHGTMDNSVPVSSARRLADVLHDVHPTFVYREIEGMGHGLGSRLPEGQREKLVRELLTWLLRSKHSEPALRFSAHADDQSTGKFSNEVGSMEKVTGIGGVFFRAKDPGMLAAWYEQHLGISRVPQDYDQDSWWQEEGPTVFSPFQQDTGYFGRPSQAWMINLRVRDLDAIVNQLRAEGIEVEVDQETYPNGRFARLHDPEGNPVELWQPVGKDAARPGR